MRGYPLRVARLPLAAHTVHVCARELCALPLSWLASTSKRPSFGRPMCTLPLPHFLCVHCPHPDAKSGAQTKCSGTADARSSRLTYVHKGADVLGNRNAPRTSVFAGAYTGSCCCRSLCAAIKERRDVVAVIALGCRVRVSMAFRCVLRTTGSFPSDPNNGGFFWRTRQPHVRDRRGAGKRGGGGSKGKSMKTLL